MGFLDFLKPRPPEPVEMRLRRAFSKSSGKIELAIKQNSQLEIDRLELYIAAACLVDMAFMTRTFVGTGRFNDEYLFNRDIMEFQQWVCAWFIAAVFNKDNNRTSEEISKFESSFSGTIAWRRGKYYGSVSEAHPFDKLADSVMWAVLKPNGGSITEKESADMERLMRPLERAVEACIEEAASAF